MLILINQGVILLSGDVASPSPSPPLYYAVLYEAISYGASAFFLSFFFFPSKCVSHQPWTRWSLCQMSIPSFSVLPTPAPPVLPRPQYFCPGEVKIAHGGLLPHWRLYVSMHWAVHSPAAQWRVHVHSDTIVIMAAMFMFMNVKHLSQCLHLSF